MPLLSSRQFMWFNFSLLATDFHYSTCAISLCCVSRTKRAYFSSNNLDFLFFCSFWGSESLVWERGVPLTTSPIRANYFRTCFFSSLCNILVRDINSFRNIQIVWRCWRRARHKHNVHNAHANNLILYLFWMRKHTFFHSISVHGVWWRGASCAQLAKEIARRHGIYQIIRRIRFMKFEQSEFGNLWRRRDAISNEFPHWQSIFVYFSRHPVSGGVWWALYSRWSLHRSYFCFSSIWDWWPSTSRGRLHSALSEIVRPFYTFPLRELCIFTSASLLLFKYFHQSQQFTKFIIV